MLCLGRGSVVGVGVYLVDNGEHSIHQVLCVHDVNYMSQVSSAMDPSV